MANNMLLSETRAITVPNRESLEMSPHRRRSSVLCARRLSVQLLAITSCGRGLQ